jgi:hypothetical protein
LAAGTGRRNAAQGSIAGFDVPGLLAELGDDRLLEIVDIGGELHVLVCGSGKVRRFAAGTAEQATRDVRFARFMLRRLAYGPSVPPSGEVRDRLTRMGGALERVLLGEACEHLGDGDVIVVPPGQLQAVPWGLLPRLRSRALSVAPSAASWLRARRAGADIQAAAAGQNATASPVVLIRGPGLASRGAEVPRPAADTPVPWCSATALRRRRGSWARSTVPAWCTSRRTAFFALTARCSPRCSSTTGR